MLWDVDLDELWEPELDVLELEDLLVDDDPEEL